MDRRWLLLSWLPIVARCVERPLEPVIPDAQAGGSEVAEPMEPWLRQALEAEQRVWEQAQQAADW